MKTEKGKQWSKKQKKTQTFRDLTNYGNDTRFLNCCKINTPKKRINKYLKIAEKGENRQIN